jgi:aminoglycoside phosphotransferase (APT) family kinase protein
MKLNPTEQCLSLVLRAHDVGVLPEVTSDSAFRAIEIIKATLNDLLKRQQDPATNFLRQCISDGHDLEKDIRQVLDESNTKLDPHTESEQQKKTMGGFESLSEQYDRLTESLNHLCVQLSTYESDDSSTPALLRRAAEWEMGYLTGQAKLSAIPFGEGQDSKAISTVPAAPLRNFLHDFLTEKYGSLEITQFSEIPGGFGKETYTATIEYESGDVEDIIIRKSHAQPMVLHAGFLLEREYHLLKSLSKTEFPVPHPIDLAYGLPGLENTFMTMTKVPGFVLGSFLEGDQQVFPEQILKQLAGLLAKLHAIPLNTFEDYFSMYDEQDTIQQTVHQIYARNLKCWREYVERVEHLPSPYITWLFYWLENNIPSDERAPVLTHGDFSVHNILAQDGKVTGVLDWECADFGAPEQDLGVYSPARIKAHEMGGLPRPLQGKRRPEY